MNKKKNAFSVMIALVVLLANVLTVLAAPAAYPADPPDVIPTKSATSTCVRTARASFDIPSSRVDYMLLDGATLCPVVAATNILLIPNTGRASSGYNDANFRSFKERQIELEMR